MDRAIDASADFLSEELLVRAAAGGDRGAFSTLFARHHGRVLARLSQLLGPSALVDDVAQETFLRAFVSLPHFRGACPFSAWLLRIATHTAHSEHRRTKRSPWRLFVAPAEEQALAGEVAAVAEAYPDSIAIHTALDRLSPRLREAVVGFELEGRTLAELAAEHDLPLHTVAARVRRGREALRAELTNMGYAAPVRRRRKRGLLMSVACVVLALLVSGTWAWVNRQHASAPTPPTVQPAFTPRPRPTAANVVPAAAPPPVAPRPRRPHRLPRRAPPAPAEVITDEPFGDVIEVHAPVKLPPLFDVEEYKSRGVLVPRE